MIRSELAEILGVNPSVVRKWLLTYSDLTGQTIETRLDSQTVTDMQSARALALAQPGMAFREALERVLGTYTAPVPPASVVELMGRLETLDTALARVEDGQDELQASQGTMAEQLERMAEQVETVTAQLETITEYLRKIFTRRTGTGGTADSALAGNEPVRPAEQALDR
ncbi:hypothetical protein [Deinococcus humi]|uniref:Uncharacterized protein n=1 Tax=Deinococcus humi TaxID=662880 RepID=A0A7W8JXU1_9DEIO|nr:hypothetical protein [Deinococcus humi]MBB5364853.1 hypothetical protein [Deinococcus humi]